MTAIALDHLTGLLCDVADYADATDEPITAEVLRIAAGAARQLAQRDHLEAA
jgi:hypothetical protein